jgi:hypothetical protein
MVKTQLNKDAPEDSDEFYRKLIELKNEQKKTLLYMQELYNQKQKLKNELTKSETDLTSLKLAPSQTENYNYILNTVSAYDNDDNNNERLSHKYDFESDKNYLESLSNKPSKVTFESTTAAISNSPQTLLTMNTNYDELKDLEDFERRRNSDIEKIWQNFELEHNTQNLKSIHFNQKFEKIKRPKTTYSSKREANRVEWVPRITVPQPFSMSIREKQKSEKKAKLTNEVKNQREKIMEDEIREGKRKFRANPVPPQVYLPLYEKLQMENEMRKMKLKKSSKEYMESVSKPFNLTEPKKVSVKVRRHSFSEGQNDDFKFSANPLPEFYTNEELNERYYCTLSLLFFKSKG